MYRKVLFSSIYKRRMSGLISSHCSLDNCCRNPLAEKLPGVDEAIASGKPGVVSSKPYGRRCDAGGKAEAFIATLSSELNSDAEVKISRLLKKQKIGRRIRILKLRDGGSGRA